MREKYTRGHLQHGLKELNSGIPAEHLIPRHEDSSSDSRACCGPGSAPSAIPYLSIMTDDSTHYEYKKFTGTCP